MRDIIMAKLFGGGNTTPSLTWDDLGRGEVETPIWSLTAEFISAGSQSFTNDAIDPAPSGLTVGQTYRVIYDGEKYDVVAKYSRGPYLGALNLQEAYPENLEYPFLIRFGNTVQVLTTTPGEHSFTIATVEEDGIIPIPEEYLPQGAGGGSGGNVTLQDVLSTDTVILDNQTLVFENIEGQINAYFPCDVYPREGDVLSVVWDGTPYECVVSLLFDEVPFAGNGAFAGVNGLGDGEPFAIAFMDGGVCSTNTAGTHTLSISGKLVNPIPSEYLDLPEPDTEIAQFYFTYDSNTGSVTTSHENVYDQIREALMAKKIAIAHLSRYYGGNGANGSSATLVCQEAYGDMALFAGIVYNSGGLRGNLVLSVRKDGVMYLGRGDLYLKSSQSAKVFKINVDDSGALSASEVTF